MDAQRLRDNLARVMMHGDEVPLFFFSDLFLRHPEVRELFPVGMDVTRDRLVAALARIVSEADNLDALVPFLQGLGRDHRKFGAVPDHFGAVGTSLIAALRHFTGPDWSAELEAEWKAAFGVVAKVMIEAAAEDQQAHPPWWDATIVSHELRAFDIAVLRLVVNEPLPYRPGQTISVESQKAPRYWRFYSVANAPREDGTLDLHVAMIDGGMVSPVLARGLAVGSRRRSSTCSTSGPRSISRPSSCASGSATPSTASLPTCPASRTCKRCRSWSMRRRRPNGSWARPGNTAASWPRTPGSAATSCSPKRG